MLARDAPMLPGAMQEQIILAIQRYEDPVVDRRIPQLRVVWDAFAAFRAHSRRAMAKSDKEWGDSFWYIFIKIEYRHYTDWFWARRLSIRVR